MKTYDMIDLHVHSTASDGTYTPSEVVLLGKQIGLKAMALTDHDTVDGLCEAEKVAIDNNFELINGIEVSCSYISKEVHIVGLFIDPNNENLKEQLQAARINRDNRNITMVEKFRERGIDISMEELIETYKDAVITRAHFASLLTKKGYTSSNKDAFDRYLNDRGPCYVPRYKIPCQDTIDMIHAAGGLAILAHPILLRLGNDELSKLVKYLKKCGLDGIEAIYSTYNRQDETLIKQLAKDNNLLLSGGSDFHGTNKPNIHLGIGKGNLSVPYSLLQEMKAKHGLL